MAKTMSMTRTQNHDDDASSSRKRFKTFDNADVAAWSDVNHDVLFIIMMQLGFVDFIAFSGVCKSWRSFAISNRKMFMASKPPMSICYTTEANNDDWCHLKDFEGRSFKTLIPHFAGRKCVGSTCGYLILCSWETRDFWLVNPITRHELHFPDYPLWKGPRYEIMRGILVFSPSISAWVLVVLHINIGRHGESKPKMVFYIAGKQRWNHVSSTVHILDLHVFKGKIYTLHKDCSLGELRLDLKRKSKWTLLETDIFLKPNLLHPKLLSSGENIFMMCGSNSKVLELDFKEMKWVLPEKRVGEYAYFISQFNYSAPFKLESWAVPQRHHKSYDYYLDDDKSPKCNFNFEQMWYFPHDCLNVNLLDE